MLGETGHPSDANATVELSNILFFETLRCKARIQNDKTDPNKELTKLISEATVALACLSRFVLVATSLPSTSAAGTC